MTKTVFVTEGAGYVWHHCCKALAAGWRIVVYDNMARGWADFVKCGPLTERVIPDWKHSPERAVAPSLTPSPTAKCR